MSHTYKALVRPRFIEVVGPDGRKRPIQAFPKVGGSKVGIVCGLDAFKLHLPYFLKARRGGRLSDPDFGSSLHALLEVEDEQQCAEIIRHVVHDEIPARFGKYLDALHAFDVTVHREVRTLHVSLELKPHGAEAVSWSFELLFPSEEDERKHREADGLRPRPRPSPRVMNDPRATELILAARHYYPAGYPEWEDDDEEPVPAYQRTPEYQRWSAIREKSRDDWKEWDDFLESVRSAFPEHDVRDVTYPSADACCFCCVYLIQPLPEGGRVVTQVVGAVSILAPLYLVYTTTSTVRPDKTVTRSKPTFTPTGEAKVYADKLTRHIEQSFGYRPFPLELADIPLPDLRIDSLNEQPTLLSALFAARDTLENLP